MTYETAITKAWKELEGLSDLNSHSVSLLSDTYEVNLRTKQIISNSCNVPVKEYQAILILHYLIGFFKNGYLPSGEWISFKEIEGGQSYYPAFHKSVIEPLLKKYGSYPENLFSVLGRFKGNKVSLGDAAIEITTFDKVKVRIILWKADSEFAAEATILFDRNITKIYSMEDVTVFSHLIISNL